MYLHVQMYNPCSTGVTYEHISNTLSCTYVHVQMYNSCSTGITYEHTYLKHMVMYMYKVNVQV